MRSAWTASCLSPTTGAPTSGYRLILRAPERFDGYLAMNMAHPWQTPASVLPHLWKLVLTSFRWRRPESSLNDARTSFVEKVIFASGPTCSPRSAAVRRRLPQPGVCPRGPRHLSHFPYPRTTLAARNPETRRATVPIRVLFGDGDAPCRCPWCHRRRRTPTITRWRRSMPPTSWSTSGLTWCARS